MRDGATTLQTTPGTADLPAGPPPGPRSAGLPPTAPLLRRAPRVRRVVDLEASSVVDLTVGPTPGAPLAVVPDESGLSLQDRIRLRAQEAAAGA